MISARSDTSDAEVFLEVFLKKAYDLDFLNFHPQTIIDGGANVGYASIFFAITFPQARIFAIEPESSNFKMLLRNVRHYQNITPLHAALWHREEELQILDTSAQKWGFKIVKAIEDKTGRVNVLTVDRLMKIGKIDTIDLFKIDIEGAEKELFSANYEKWLEKTKVIIIELHDRFRDGCDEVLSNATKPYKFNREERKTHVVLFRTCNNSLG